MHGAIVYMLASPTVRLLYKRNSHLFHKVQIQVVQLY